MRGALELDGVEAVRIEVGSTDFQVGFDPERIDPERILAAVREAGEAVELLEREAP